jgi:hypothetical protein
MSPGVAMNGGRFSGTIGIGRIFSLFPILC